MSGLSGRQYFNEKTPRRVQGSDHPFVSSMPSGLAPSRSLRLESVDTGVPPFTSVNSRFAITPNASTASSCKVDDGSSHPVVHAVRVVRVGVPQEREPTNDEDYCITYEVTVCDHSPQQGADFPLSYSCTAPLTSLGL